MNMLWYIILILAAFGGLLLASYIRHKKQTHGQMICPLSSDCSAVIHSEYSRFLGIPVEILGIFYYGFVALCYVLFLVFPALATPTIVFGILALTTGAFLFSLYLTFIQIFVLKQWCTWCLMSAGLCAVIFATVLGAYEFGLVALLESYQELILIGHFLGVALGLGGAMITDIFSFKFLKDFRISKWEADVMRTLSQVIWFALALLVLTGVGLYLPQAEELKQSAKFLVKMIAVATLIVNGTLLSLLIAPKLVKISFRQQRRHEVGKLRSIRKATFALGAVSIVSWYSVFILGMLRQSPLEFLPLLLVYLFVLGGAITVSQFMERMFTKRANPVIEH